MMSELKESPRFMQRKIKAAAMKCTGSLAKIKALGSSGTKSVTPSWESCDDATRKHRRQIDAYLRRFDNDLHLGEKGVCSFQYHNKFVVTIDVPASEDDQVYIFALVYQIEEGSGVQRRLDVLQSAMQMNNMQQGTRGCTLGLNDDEVILCYSSCVSTMTEDKFLEALDDFTTAAFECNQELEHSCKQWWGTK